MTELPGWLENRRRSTICIQYNDRTMFLLRKLNSGKVWFSTYTWWFDIEERMYCCESWEGLHQSMAQFNPEHTHLERFETADALKTHLWGRFGGYTMDFEVKEL